MTLLLLLMLGACAGRGGEVQRAAEPGIAGHWITIQRGDTLGAIARRAEVPLERLMRFNPGVDARRLAVGQRLLVPTHRERAPSGGPYRYQIRPGDTYAGIARRFGTTPARIQNANPGVEPRQLRVGHVVQVPLKDTQPARTASASTRRAAAAKPASPAAATTSPGATASGSLPASARNWPWPLDDYRIVRRYGTDSRGTLQPMLLASREGAQAQAVAEGEVRFSGSMRQLGRVVIVHHADNLQSVYALCDSLTVKEGSRVKRGTPLCAVGYSNATERYDLLFDLRHGGKPIDPQRVLR
ncbi:LysM peptidoglycan-binding domain-containing protein [Halomonas sp. NO4]|uniref:LysM peptidoglycan-binding domain-containing protein n=1 Tax=Halomonas sp. NO4 TaxID=2484813 RepID=UPI001F092267|nr:LysM peptidoglycan-binding domain-containing protein [Halomonas sp. NO4]